MKRMDTETRIRIADAGGDHVVVYTMIPEVARVLSDLLMEAASGDSGFETDTRNLRLYANRADQLRMIDEATA